MKKFILFIMLLLFSSPVLAKTIPVQSHADFSTENPPQTLSITILQDIELDENLSFTAGDIVEGEIVDVTDPKRLKRDAGFTFLPQKIKKDNGEIVQIKDNYPAKYTTKLNKADMAKSAALGVGNYFVKGLSMAYSAVEGAVKNEQDNRLKSSANSVYESSPLSLVEKGGEIVIQKDQTFLLNFKTRKSEEENLPNYEYEELPSKDI